MSSGVTSAKSPARSLNLAITGDEIKGVHRSCGAEAAARREAVGLGRHQRPGVKDGTGNGR